MKVNEIEELLVRYYDGETNEAEEKELNSLPTDAEPTKPQPIITAFFNNHFLLCNNLLLFNSSLHVLRNNSVDGYILDISQVPLFLPQHVHSYGIPIP